MTNERDAPVEGKEKKENTQRERERERENDRDAEKLFEIDEDDRRRVGVAWRAFDA